MCVCEYVEWSLSEMTIVSEHVVREQGSDTSAKNRVETFPHLQLREGNCFRETGIEPKIVRFTQSCNA